MGAGVALILGNLCTYVLERAAVFYAGAGFFLIWTLRIGSAIVNVKGGDATALLSSALALGFVGGLGVVMLSGSFEKRIVISGVATAGANMVSLNVVLLAGLWGASVGSLINTVVFSVLVVMSTPLQFYVT